MGSIVIGVDPHKRSHTAVVLDEREELAAQLQVTADPRQVDRLLAWAAQWPDRMWAIENVNGLGRLLAQQLVSRGEQVVDVPGVLTARTRRLSGHSARKTDPFDARSVAIVGAASRRLPRVQAEDFSMVIRVLVDRRWHLVSHRHRTICRLHDLIADLVPSGAKTGLSVHQAARILRGLRPASATDAERRAIVRELIEEWRWLNRRVKTVDERLDQALKIHGTTLTEIYGIGATGAAAIVAIVGDVSRFASAGHFAAFNGTAPIEASSGDVKRHRLNRRGNRQLNKVLHVAALSQIRNGAPGRDHYLRKLEQGKTKREAVRSLKRQLSNVIYRRMLADAKTAEHRGGPGWTPEDETEVRVTGSHP